MGRGEGLGLTGVGVTGGRQPTGVGLTVSWEG